MLAKQMEQYPVSPIPRVSGRFPCKPNVPFPVSGAERQEFSKDVSSGYKEPVTLGSEDITVNKRASNPCAHEVYIPVGADRQQTNKKQNAAKYVATSDSDVC